MYPIFYFGEEKLKKSNPSLVTGGGALFAFSLKPASGMYVTRAMTRLFVVAWWKGAVVKIYSMFLITEYTHGSIYLYIKRIFSL